MSIATNSNLSARYTAALPTKEKQQHNSTQNEVSWFQKQPAKEKSDINTRSTSQASSVDTDGKLLEAWQRRFDMIHDQFDGYNYV